MSCLGNNNFLLFLSCIKITSSKEVLTGTLELIEWSKLIHKSQEQRLMKIYMGMRKLFKSQIKKFYNDFLGWNNFFCEMFSFLILLIQSYSESKSEFYEEYLEKDVYTVDVFYRITC